MSKAFELSEETRKQLIYLALEGLEYMYLPESHLFCFRVTNSSGKLIREGISPRYSSMSLIGLCSSGNKDIQKKWKVVEILKKIKEKALISGSIGDIGLYMWAFTICMKDYDREILSFVDKGINEKYFMDYNEKSTMSIAWILSGFCHSSNYAYKNDKDNIMNITNRFYRELNENYNSEMHLVRHCRNTTWRGKLRGWIGSFADQIYPIYSLCKYYELTKDERALKQAEEITAKICSLQGEKGQWWWHYDVNKGSVISAYPVYSVHQDGMAPMALNALPEARKQPYLENINRSFSWIFGNNEVGLSMVDWDKKCIWRCLQLSKLENTLNYVRYFVRKNTIMEKSGDSRYQILYECRPYHLGWLLYFLR